LYPVLTARREESVTQQASGPVLFEDYDGDFLEISTRILQQAGYETLEAATGEEALEIARRERPGLVVLDVRLRGELTGHEVCRMLKDELSPEPAVLLVSGARIESFDRVGGLLIGADDYIVKPFATDEFLARVRALLRRSNPRPAAGSKLTTDDLEVVRLLKDGLGEAEIAQRLEISPTTARQQIEELFSKLGV
jgi:DNA-binding response OmpR family regulator